ncbi:hypothetical protein BDN71DRAFT_111340 [Pleurotus eryngii]|uniref:Secreted protein n=1 Tax=Pleurotus eryngii TaxID=5323 RepID=A0A9P5ZPZ3_PLEER|nr:hypothetical protein BDN71DRAFT_111340 [Pleurotus eryngii]
MGRAMHLWRLPVIASRIVQAVEFGFFNFEKLHHRAIICSWQSTVILLETSFTRPTGTAHLAGAVRSPRWSR